MHVQKPRLSEQCAPVHLAPAPCTRRTLVASGPLLPLPVGYSMPGGQTTTSASNVQVRHASHLRECEHGGRGVVRLRRLARMPHARGQADRLSAQLRRSGRGAVALRQVVAHNLNSLAGAQNLRGEGSRVGKDRSSDRGRPGMLLAVLHAPSVRRFAPPTRRRWPR